ncbi:MAG: hypothetical protein ACK4IK_03040 [Bacteroidia bacterium]
MKRILIIFLLTASIFSCKKERTVLYDVQDAYVKRDGANKSRLKTTTEFIAIAYSDIFGTTIPQNKLEEISLVYESFGDKKLMEDIIVKNFINHPSAQIPSASAMNADLDKFITDAYKKLYSREPSETELFKVKELIKSNTAITPTVFYYALMTSNEYRYY